MLLPKSHRRRSGFLSRRIGSAVALALALSCAAGCSSKQDLTPSQQAQADLAEYEMQIRRIIPDPARADQLVALTNQFQELAQTSIASVNEYRAKVSALNSNYEATRADYEALFSQQDAAREAFFKKAGALRERMVVFTSDAEWEQLRAVHLRLLEADLQQLLE
jgi:voltage-gated potassium channel Kch